MARQPFAIAPDSFTETDGQLMMRRLSRIFISPNPTFSNRWTACGLALAGLLSAAPALAQAQSAVPPAYANPASAPQYLDAVRCNGVLRRARLLTPSASQGEPLLIELQVEGDAKGRPAEFTGALTLGSDFRAVVVPDQSLGIAPFEVKDPLIRRNQRVGTSLEYDQRVSRVQILAYDHDSLSGALSDTAGAYRMATALYCFEDADGATATYQDLGVFSYDVTPASGDDKKALEWIEDPEVFLSLQNLALLDPSHRGPLERIAQETPAAALRPYALLTLAMGDLAAAVRASEEEVKSYVASAVEQLRRFTFDYPSHPLAYTAYSKLIDALVSSGDTQAAREVYIRMRRDPYLAQNLTERNILTQFFMGDPRTEVERDWMVFAEPEAAMVTDDPRALENQLPSVQQEVQLALAPSIYALVGLGER